MALIKTKGIVIKEQPYKEQDKILTLFTEEEGKIQCIARSVRRQKSTLLASTQIFSYGEYVYYPGKNFGSINQGSLIESFYALRNNMDKMLLGSYLLDLVNNAFDFYQKNPIILKLLLHVLFYISEGKALSDNIIVGGFQMKLVSVLGYRPILNGCSKCERKENLNYFSIENHGVVCKNCYSKEGYYYKIDDEMVEIMLAFLGSSMKELKDKEFSKDAVLKVNDILDHYIGICIGKKSKAYEFYKNLK
ncbi:MAG: DNA repair protein RecO [Eubacteriaceae bacterium]